MNEPVIKILGPLYPKCATEGCKHMAEDGYCFASCCATAQEPQAYCNEHSHRPARVLELLGHSPGKATYTLAEVRQIVIGMWLGAGKVFESEGHIAMLQDIVRRRDEAGIPAGDLLKP